MSGRMKESLLLHACCAVCAGGVLAREFEFEGKKKRLTDFFDITLYFCNPNIDTQEEYDRRAVELEKLKPVFPIANVVVEEYRPEEFHQDIKGCENYGYESGLRCDLCISLRLLQTAQYAVKNRFDRFTTALTVSPHKDAGRVTSCGERIGREVQIPFLTADFKKEHGFLAATKTAKKLELYRQNYCGCVYGRK